MAKYIIERASMEHTSDGRPCAEAQRESVTFVHKLPYSLSEAQKNRPWWKFFIEYQDKWEEVDGKLIGYKYELKWVVNSTIEEICAKYGELTVYKTDYSEAPFGIKINDEYR